MQELKDFFETLVKAIPLHGLEEDTAQLVRDALNSKAAKAIEAIEKRLASAVILQGPVPGAPVDEDLPPAPDHWSRVEKEPVAPAPIDPAAPAPGVPVVATPPATDQSALDAALAQLSPAPGNAGLPSTTLAEQQAAAGAPPAS